MSFPNNRHGNTPPYLLSAYGIAVKHGYTGTEEEWLASLKGDQGEYPRMQFDSETGYLQIRYDDSGEWTDIASLADLMTESEEAVVASAKEYADTAEAYAKGTVDGEAVEEGDPGYEDNAKYYAGQASTYASAAGGFATGASNYAQAASGYATTASGHADNAAASATAAAGSATSAAGSAASASNSAGSASTSASAAEAQATQAGTYAYNADQSAQAAASYAAAANTAYSAVVDVANGVDVKVEDIETQVSIAAGYASAAGTSATNASGSATAAAGSATAAAGSASSAADSATAAAGSATAAAGSATSVSESAAQITTNKNDIADLKSAIDDVDRTGKIPYIVHEKTVLDTNGVETTNTNLRVIYFDVSNTGVYFVHNCNRKSLQATSIAGYDSNGDYVTDGITYGTRGSTYSTAIIPASGVKKVGVSMWNLGYSQQGFVVNDEPYITQVTAFDINPNIVQYSDYPFIGNIFNQLFSLRGVEWTGSSFTTSNEGLANYGFIPVNAGDTLQITFTGTSNNYGAFSSFIHYFASDFSFISNAKYNTGIFTMPANTKYVCFMYFWVDNDKCVIKHINASAPDIKIDERALPAISSTDYSAYPLYVNIANDVLEVTYKYGNGYDMTVQMQKQGGLDENNNPVGGNQLFDFCRWYITANNSRIVTDNPDKSAYYNINGTDYFGPYRVRAVNNADGDKAANDDFTGGNHQYNNTGSGSTATARTASIVFSVDGKVVTNFAGYAKTVQVDWINYVQGNNTKKADGTGREILTEHYTVRFDGDKFRVKNVIEALEEIYIYTYYGMQAKQMYSGSAGAYAIDPLYYLGSKANRERQPRNTATNAGDKYCREIVFAGRNDVLDMFMDDIGLGDFALATADPVSAFSSPGKLYFNLINATSSEGGLTLNAKDVVYYTGWYQFRPKLA